MYQLRNLINRNSIPTDPSSNMNSAEDFLLLLLHAYNVAAANTILDVTQFTSANELARAIVLNYVRIENQSQCEDGVYGYAVEFLTLALLWHGFHDAIREGDGERILRYWKFLFVIFTSSNKRNYAKETVMFLLQYYYLLSDRQKEQLLWNRCINTRGYQGANIPCDLHMEHLNRRLKIMMRNLGANIRPKSIEKAGRTIGIVQHVCHVFEEQTCSYKPSFHHPYPDFGKDFAQVLEVLEEVSVFTPQGNRQHPSYRSSRGLLQKFCRSDLLAKIEHIIKQIYRH